MTFLLEKIKVYVLKKNNRLIHSITLNNYLKNIKKFQFIIYLLKKNIYFQFLYYK